MKGIKAWGFGMKGGPEWRGEKKGREEKCKRDNRKEGSESWRRKKYERRGSLSAKQATKNMKLPLWFSNRGLAAAACRVPVFLHYCDVWWSRRRSASSWVGSEQREGTSPQCFDTFRNRQVVPGCPAPSSPPPTKKKRRRRLEKGGGKMRVHLGASCSAMTQAHLCVCGSVALPVSQCMCVCVYMMYTRLCSCMHMWKPAHFQYTGRWMCALCTRLRVCNRV